MAGKNQYVIRHPGGWAVKGEGNKKATVVCRTQREAIYQAEKIARNQQSEIWVQDVDDEESDSHCSKITICISPRIKGKIQVVLCLS